MKRIIFLSLSLVTLLFFGQIGAFACTCVEIGNPTLEERVKSSLEISKIAFSGTVIEVKENTNNNSFITKFKIKELWKGSPGEELILIGQANSCQYRFTVNDDYLVFAYIWKNVLTTGDCVGNSSLLKATEELKILGKGEKPKKSRP